MSEKPLQTSQSVRGADMTSLHAAIQQAGWWAVMFGAGEVSFGLFATHVKAPEWFFGFLMGVPMLLGPLTQVFGAWVLDRYPHRRRMVLWSVASQILCFAPLAILPFLPVSAAIHVFLLALVVAYVMGGHFGAPAWSSLISVLVPSSWRSDYFARQNRVISIVALVSQLVVGGALFLAGWLGPRHWPGREAEVVAWVFAAAFVIAGGARAVTFRWIRKMADPPYVVKPEETFTFWQFIRRVRESNFVRFVLFTAFLHFGVMLSAPYFLPYWRYELKYENWQWVVLSCFGTLASFLALTYWARFAERFGNKKTMKYSCYAAALIPVFWLLSTNMYYLIAVNCFSGAAWSGFVLSAGNYMLEAVSPPKRARCGAYFSLIVGAAAFLGSIQGAWLLPLLPEYPMTPTVHTKFFWLLLLSAALRYLAGHLLLPTFRELRDVERMSIKRRIFQAATARIPMIQNFGWLMPGDEEDGSAGPPPPRY